MARPAWANIPSPNAGLTVSWFQDESREGNGAEAVMIVPRLVVGHRRRQRTDADTHGVGVGIAEMADGDIGSHGELRGDRILLPEAALNEP